jgi:DNA-binding beta-propeller fold protein YncE
MFGSNLYLSSSVTNQIVKVNLDKEQALSVVAGNGISGGSDGEATAASFSGPLDVAVDPDGIYAYVADTGNHLIRRIHLFYRKVTTVAGQFEVKGCADGLGTAALLNSPTALVVTPNGERLLFVEGGGDFPNHVVREYRLAPPDKFAVRCDAAHHQ